MLKNGIRRGAAMLLVVLALIPPVVSATQVLDRIVAVVNDDVVLQSELQQEMQTVRMQIRQRNMQMPPENELRRQVLERLIMKKLQLGAAKKAGITVDDATLDAAVRRVAERNRLSLSAFRDALQSEGMTMAGFRDQLRDDIIISRLRHQEMQQRVNVTPQEIDQALAQDKNSQSEYRLAHILIAVPEAASADEIQQAKAKAQRIHQQLESGANFATVAASYSDSRTALEGGDLGWRPRAEIPTLLASRIDQMSVGDITPVLRSPAGFHIFQISDERKGQRHIVTQTHVRHILIKTNTVVSDKDARLRLESLRRRIQNGESFAELARANSDDKNSASNGGDLGWVEPGSLVPRFEQVMNGLKPNEISEPFQTQFGWHIAEVLGRRKRDTTEEYRRNQAANQIRQRKEEEEMELWLRQLRQDAYVDYRLQG